MVSVTDNPDPKGQRNPDLSSSSRSDSVREHQGKLVALNPFFKGQVATEDDFSSSLDTLASHDKEPISVYIHIPYSPYQLSTDNTLSIASHGGSEVDEYINSIEHEITAITDRIGRKRWINQLHIGGNAPNSISQRQLVRLLDIVEQHFQIDENTETSMAADPGRTSIAQMELLHGLGFKQVNFGVCDMDPSTQEAIGRIQSPELIKESFAASREAGMELVTSDLVYGMPSQTVSSIQETVERYLDIEPDRIICRCYQGDSQISSSRHRPRHLPSTADKMAAFHAVVEGLTSNGYEWVGLDCFSKPADAITSKETRLYRNRIGYSTVACSQVLGFGSDAISEIEGIAMQNHAPVEKWSQAVNNGLRPVVRGIRLDKGAMQRRAALTELMCRTQTEDATALLEDAESEATMRQLEQNGMIEVSDKVISVTAAGLLSLNQIWEDIFPSTLPH